MAGTIVWSNSATFSQSFTRTADPAATGFGFNALAYPGGLPLLDSSILIYATAVTVSPGVGFGVDNDSFRFGPPSTGIVFPHLLTLIPQDSNGTLGGGSGGVQFVGSGPAKGYLVFSGLGFESQPHDHLAGGGNLILYGAFTDASELVSGVVVACIYTTNDSLDGAFGSTVHEQIQLIPPPGSSALDFRVDTETVASPLTITIPFVTDTASALLRASIDGAAATVSSVADSGTAALPTFALDPLWSDVVARASGAHSAAIGLYNGPVDSTGSTPISFTASYSKGVGAFFANELRHLVDVHGRARPRAVQVIG